MAGLGNLLLSDRFYLGDPPNQLHPVTWIGRWLSWGHV